MSTYETAISEYESEDEDGRHRLVYAYFGLAVYFSQCLEASFVVMLITHRLQKCNVKTNIEANKIIDEIEGSKKTLRNLINEATKCYRLPIKLKEDLEKILNRRNYLIHNYFKVEIVKAYSDIGRKQMLQYFCSFIDDSKQIDEKLISYYSSYAKQIGLTEEKIEKLQETMVAQEKERDSRILNTDF